MDIAGAIGSAYTTPATSPGDNGSLFRVLVSNASGTTVSAQAILTIAVVGTNPIGLSTGAVTFVASSGSTAPVTAMVTLTNRSGAAITVTGSTGADWLVVGAVTVPSGGSATLSLVASPAGTGGATSDTLVLSNSTGETQTMAVSLMVGTPAGLRKRSCAVGARAGSDWLILLFALAGLAVRSSAVRRA